MKLEKAAPLDLLDLSSQDGCKSHHLTFGEGVFFRIVMNRRCLVGNEQIDVLQAP